MEMEMNIMNTYTVPKSILIGDRVRYECAAGTIRGEVVDVVPGLNGRNQMIDWIIVEYCVNTRMKRTRLAEPTLGMYKFQVTFRDYDKKVA